VIAESALERELIGSLRNHIKDLILDYDIKEAPAKDRSAQIAEYRKKIDRLKELFVNDLIGLDEYKEDKEQYQKQIEELEADEQKPSGVDLDSLRALLNTSFEEMYAHMDRTEKRRFWRAILKEIRFGMDRSIDVFF
jgi:hypothetical protein